VTIAEVEVLDPEAVAAELTKTEQQAGLAEDAAIALRGQFADYYQQIVEWRGKALAVSNPESPTDQKIAREVRLGLKNVRCEVERVRKALKADSLARGKAIDGFANVLKYLCEPVEEKLMAVEQYAERQEAARIAQIVEERTRELSALGADPAAYNLGAMDDDTFRLILDAARKSKAEREEAARKAEAERVAREQADRIAREKAEKEAAEARKLAEAERKAREEFEAVARKEKAANDAKLKAEREVREKAEREAAEAKRREQARIDAEKAAAAEKANAERAAAEKAARAPDKAKLIAYADALCSVEFPVASTVDGEAAFYEVAKTLTKFSDWIRDQAGKL